MLKWILGILAVVLLLKRNATPDSVTTANAAPPEGNISSWANQGSKTVGAVDSGGFYINSFGTPTQSKTQRPVPPIRVMPTVADFSTRGFYNNTSRYTIPGRN